MGKETLGEKLKNLRKTKGETQEQVAHNIGCTVKTYREWEHDTNIPRSDYLDALVRYFDVDMDHLIGRIEEGTHDKKFICEYTGLSEEAIELLHLAAVSEEAESKRTLRFLNMVLADPDNNAKKKAKEGKPITTAFSDMDRFVHSKSAMLSERYGEDEQFRKTVTMDLDDESYMLTAPELLRQFLMNEIQKSLERYQVQASKEKNRGKQ